MPSGGYRRLTAFIFLVNSHSKKSLFLLTMGLAGRIHDNSGIRLLIDGIEIAIEKGFDGTTLSEVLNLLKRQSCSASAAR